MNQDVFDIEELFFEFCTVRLCYGAAILSQIFLRDLVLFRPPDPAV